MMPICVESQAPISPPAYSRVQARSKDALHIDALTLIRTLHLLALCRLAVRLAHYRCPPPLPVGPGCAPRTYSEASLLLIALVRTSLPPLPTWGMHDWLEDWPALALACGLPLNRRGRPRIPSPSRQCKRLRAAGAPLFKGFFVLTVLLALHRRLIGARDLITDSAPILAWRRADPVAAIGHALAPHPRPLLRGYRVHTLLCRGSGLPLLFLLSPESAPRCSVRSATLIVGSSPLSPPPSDHPPRCRLLGAATHPLDPCHPGCRGCHPLESQTAEEPFLPSTHLDCSGVRQAHLHRTLLWPRLPLFSPAASSAVWLVSHRHPRRFDVHRLHRCRAVCSTGWAS
jgi:hypothetical protein